MLKLNSINARSPWKANQGIWRNVPKESLWTDDKTLIKKLSQTVYTFLEYTYAEIGRCRPMGFREIMEFMRIFYNAPALTSTSHTDQTPLKPEPGPLGPIWRHKVETLFALLVLARKYTNHSDKWPVIPPPLAQNGPHFADDVLKRIFLNEKVLFLTTISLKFVRKGLFDNNPALV